MSQLVIDQETIIKAIMSYFNDYEPELYKKFDFAELRFVYKVEDEELTVKVESL